MLITDGRKVVEIVIKAMDKDTYRLGQDITADLIIDSGWKHDETTDMWVIGNVDFCVEQVKDMVDGQGDWLYDGPMDDVDLTINPIRQKSEDFTPAQLLAICHLAREAMLKAKDLPEMDMYTEIEDTAMSILLGN